MVKVKDANADQPGAPPKLDVKDMLCGKRARKWLFFGFIAILAAATVFEVVKLVMEVMEDNKVADINVVFNKTMTLPNMTYCLNKNQAFSMFQINQSEPTDVWNAKVEEKIGNVTKKQLLSADEWDWRMVWDVYDFVALYTSIEREMVNPGTARTIAKLRMNPQFGEKRATISRWLKLMDDLDISFDELMHKVGVEVLRRLIVKIERPYPDHEEITVNTRFRPTWISQMELCFQPDWDEKNYYPVDNQLVFFKMMLRYNASNMGDADSECMKVDFHGRPSSMARFIEGGGVEKDGYNDNLCFGDRHEVKVSYRAHYILLESTEDNEACKDYSDVDEDEAKSQLDCKMKCKLDFIRDICDCTARSLEYLVRDKDELKKYPLCDYSQCDLDLKAGNFTGPECTCYRTCDSFRIDVQRERLGKMAKQDMTYIDVQFGTFEYLELERKLKYNIYEFLGALGGALGMWLGLSLLSIIQIGTYAWAYLKEHVWGKDEDKEPLAPSADKEKIFSARGNPFEPPIKHTKKTNAPAPVNNNNVEVATDNGETRINLDG